MIHPDPSEKDETKTREAAVYFAYLLNFTELYAVLLFRTLPPEILRAYLPKKSDVNPYQWVGLNSVNPITQFRSVLGEFVPVSKVQHPLSRMLGIGCRRPDKSKGDRTMVELVCPKCYNPNHVLLDKQPLYEIATGRYLKRQAQHYCPSCMEKRIFVPKDNSISSVCFAVVLQNVQKLEAKMNVPKVECRDDLVDLTKPQLKAWIYSRNFEPTGGLTKESLFTLAGILLDQLLGWQLPEAEARLREFRARSNQPPRKLQTPPSTPEEVQIPPCTAVDKPARRDEENSETKTQEKPQDWMHINNRDQLKSLGPITTWKLGSVGRIQSKMRQEDIAFNGPLRFGKQQGKADHHVPINGSCRILSAAFASEDCHTIVLEEETSADIVNYVNSETKRIAREILKCSHEELSFISSYLIEASQGIFLWVKLVLDQLDVRATDGFCSVAELEQLLLSIPKDLRQLYKLILKRIVRGPDKNVRECQTVFRWIAFSPTPLRVEDMLEVAAASACSDSDIITRTELQRHRVRNTEDMRRRLISLCGNLVEVKRRIVQFIHTSVREYLLESACAPPISLAP